MTTTILSEIEADAPAQTDLLRRAEEQIRNARLHFERGADYWGRAFMVDAARLIEEASK